MPDASPTLLASVNAMVGMSEGRTVLEAGGTAIDAATAVVAVVEDHADDHTVGYGGYPNILGDVELDAAVMDGRTRAAGAVAALVGFRNPIAVARAVMEHLPHVLVVGDGAARFADEMGMERRDMLTSSARTTWQRGIDSLDTFDPEGVLRDHVLRLVLDPEHVTGTVNVIARDRDGHLASATSTSGWAWKYPGRAGDTGLIGAGSYCDDRSGAATCTGWGELAVRAGAARAVVFGMQHGRPPEDACRDVLSDLPDAGVAGDTPLHILALHPNGTYAAASTAPDSRYAYWDSELDAPVARDRIQTNPQEHSR
jgi:beta-aspartyl-peptidase (threonine type)